jgi:membrane protease YdiL (CAAX protease family)
VRDDDAARRVRGPLAVCLAVMLPLYAAVVAAMPALRRLSSTGTSVVSFPLLVAFAAATALAIRATGLPWATFGLTTRRLWPSVREGALLTLPALLLVTAAKAAWVAAAPDAGAVFDAGRIAARYSPGAYVFYVVVYGLFTFLQELVARGGVQTALELVLSGPRRRLSALLLADLLFAATHLHVSAALAAAVFVPGLFWGWMYARQRTLAGVTASHAMIGLYAYFVLGMPLPRG